MSRRAPAAPDRSEQNRATLKQLVKLEPNKSCADCKRNKHPRWASWNLGIFLCIRCSGIHRGMGTHISRVKSVDLDSWTDEQMANMLRWGNARANKYWEHKLAEGHVPNEAKIENFIRTKYDSKRWVMDGPMPDPSTLGDEAVDDDVPLNVVREKAIERRVSQRNGSGPAAIQGPPRTRPQDVDLFGDAEESAAAPARPSTTEPAVQRQGVAKAPAVPPKQTKPGESLLGLDFFGGGTQSAPPARPSSTGSGPGTPGVPGRADLKSSILSLYASKPAAPPQPQPQVQQQSNMGAFAGMQSPPLMSPNQPQQNAQQSFGGMNDAFGSLSFTSPQQPQANPSPFSNLTSPTGQTRQPSASQPALSGGSFFDTKPAPPPKPTSPPMTTARKESFGGGDWGDFSSAASPPISTTTAAKSPPPVTSSGMGDLFDFTAPSPPTARQAPVPAPALTPTQRQPSNYSSNNAFNLSQPAPQPPPAPKLAQPSTLPNFSSLNNMDAWGSNDAWATPDPAPAPQQPTQINTTSSTFKPAPAPSMQTPFDSGWGDMTSSSASTSKPAATSAGGFNVQQDEEFGGWSHASPVATSAGPKQSSSSTGGGFGGGSDDLFGNVWE